MEGTRAKQGNRLVKDNDNINVDVCVITEDAFDLLSISYSIGHDADNQHAFLLKKVE